MDPDELDKLEQEQLQDREQTPPFNAGGVEPDDPLDLDAEQQADVLPADHPQLDDDIDDTEFYNEGEFKDNPEADEPDSPDVDSHEDPAKQ